MFNETVKSAFIEKYTESDRTKKLIRYIFEATGSIEEKYATDFYALDAEQAQEAFNSASGTRVNGASTILMLLKSYVRWCAANGYKVSEAVRSLRIDVYDKIRESYVASAEHLLESMNQAFPSPDKNEIEYVYRSFLWLGFIGLQASEAIQVTAEHIDLNAFVLHFPGHSAPYRIYSEAVSDLKKAISLKEFLEPRGQEGLKRLRAGGKEILRGKVSKRSLSEAVELTFRPTISRAFKAALERYESRGMEVPKRYSLKLTFKHVYMSGIFFRAYERERMGISPDFGAIVIHERRNAKESHFSTNYTERKLLNILIRDMEQDYDNWKSVFS